MKFIGQMMSHSFVINEVPDPRDSSKKRAINCIYDIWHTVGNSTLQFISFRSEFDLLFVLVTLRLSLRFFTFIAVWAIHQVVSRSWTTSFANKEHSRVLSPYDMRDLETNKILKACLLFNLGWFITHLAYGRKSFWKKKSVQN